MKRLISIAALGMFVATAAAGQSFNGNVNSFNNTDLQIGSQVTHWHNANMFRNNNAAFFIQPTEMTYDAALRIDLRHWPKDTDVFHYEMPCSGKATCYEIRAKIGDNDLIVDRHNEIVKNTLTRAQEDYVVRQLVGFAASKIGVTQ